MLHLNVRHLFSSPEALLLVLTPLVWWGAFEVRWLWVLPVLSVAYWYEQRNVRALDVAHLVVFLLGVFIGWSSGLNWYASLGLVLRFLFGAFLMSFAVRAIMSSGANRAAWGLLALTAVWFTAPSGVGLFALLACGVLAGSVQQGQKQHRTLVMTPRAWMLALGALLVSLGSETFRLAGPAGITYRDAGGTESPFQGFNFGWSTGEFTSVPWWLNWVQVVPYVLLGLLALVGFAALMWAARGWFRVAREDWNPWWLRSAQENEHGQPEPPGAPEGVRRVYEQFLRLAAQHGFSRRPSETSQEFEERVTHWRPDWSDDVRTLSRAYALVRYGDQPSPALLDAARESLARIQGTLDEGNRVGERT